MKYLPAIFICITVLAIGGCSGRKTGAAAAGTEVVKVSLPSMVCDNCARTIRSAVVQVKGVTDVQVDVDKKQAAITFVTGQTNLDQIESAITTAGYDANGKKRNMEAYQKLDKCCKIDG